MTYDLTNEATKGYDVGRYPNLYSGDNAENPYLFSSPGYAAWQIGKWCAETKRPYPTNVRPSRGDTFHLNGGKVRLVYGHKGSAPDIIEHH
jgi:hypothetical protein